MDKSTRSQIQRATQDARRLLEREYADQLEGAYDIRASGTIGDAAAVRLDAAGQVVRDKLVAAVAHHQAGGAPTKDAVAAYLREAAFTTLNRFVALKMLEARGLVRECVSCGDQSRGFKEYGGLAPGLVQLPDKGYRLFIESIFDELGTEVRVLFDRRDAASLLWPRARALSDLLGLLNAPDLAEVWAADETLGWVYQYFNGEDERRQMRKASGAPRNGRELAVRNQFFTPRYVVEFLTDNTLGRTWFEMRRGATRLAETCAFLVRRSDETFDPPRPKKDPRDLKLLDPAGGSGHFLLYAFDLFLVIYDEAWSDAASPASEATGRTLRDDYATMADLRSALPGLILRHNLHLVDIDPRAVQIAALALWLRAQRAYNDLGIARTDRPPILRTNVVVAEPMAGDADLRAEFVASLGDKALGRLVERVFEAMALAGDMGPLLKIEDELGAAVREAFPGWGAIFDAQNTDSWQAAEAKLLAALKHYAEHAERAEGTSGYRRRLFAEDAAHGFAFIDLCRQKYDVVLMNPPFGAGSLRAKGAFEKAYPRTKNDVYAAFVERGVGLLHKRAMLGAITSRTGFFLSSFQKWREEVLLKEAPPTVFADLGYGVLDSAMVEVAAYCLEVAAE